MLSLTIVLKSLYATHAIALAPPGKILVSPASATHHRTSNSSLPPPSVLFPSLSSTWPRAHTFYATHAFLQFFFKKYKFYLIVAICYLILKFFPGSAIKRPSDARSFDIMESYSNSLNSSSREIFGDQIHQHATCPGVLCYTCFLQPAPEISEGPGKKMCRK